MIIAEATIDSVLKRIGTDQLNDTHRWDRMIFSFDPPQWKTDYLWGGLCRFNFGAIGLSIELFSGMPARTIDLTIKYTGSTEAAATTIFIGTGYLSDLRPGGVAQYDLYSDISDVQLLSEDTDYDGNDVVFPQAFGRTDYKRPVRVADVSGKPTYHKAGLTSVLPAPWVSSVSSNSGWAQINCASAHNCVVEDYIGFETVDFQSPYRANDLLRVVQVVSSTSIVVDMLYSATATGHLYRKENGITFAYLWDYYYRVFDDGVPISNNVVDNGDGTFSLNATPAGDVSISGAGPGHNLGGLFQWACDASRLNLTYDGSGLSEDTYTNINYWADSQALLLDFLSEVSAFSFHVFYIEGSTLLPFYWTSGNNGIETLAVEYKPNRYWYDEPLSIIKSTWTVNRAVEETIGKYVKTLDYEASYQTPHPFGQPMDIRNFDCLSYPDKIRNKIYFLYAYSGAWRQWASVTIPISGQLPKPHRVYNWTESDIGGTPFDFRIYARNIQYDFERETATIEGEGLVLT